MNRACLFSAVVSCLSGSAVTAAEDSPLLDCIKPIIGASTNDNMNPGKTFPGTATPFGLVQLSPDTVTGGDNGSGYSYEHKTIEGFSFTHMSGVGWYGDLGNFLVMPTTGKLKTERGVRGAEDGYRSRFHHETEIAKAGYYAVTLDDYQVRAEATTAPRAGILRFTFPRSDLSRIQIDLARRVGGTSTWTRWEGATREGQGCVESNPYQQGWFVPHDVQGLIQLMGKDYFLRYLEDFFEKTPADFRWNEYDNHSNEPVHHVPYLFAYAGKPWLTQKWSRFIMDHAYGDNVYGICGNDDVGQMSAWYVLSAIGFYPVSPVDGVYVIGSPLFRKVTIRLDPQYYVGRKFTVIAENNSPRNIYIQSAKLNGKPLERDWIRHAEIAAGGTLLFVMGPEPNTHWPSSPDRPPSLTGCWVACWFGSLRCTVSHAPVGFGSGRTTCRGCTSNCAVWLRQRLLAGYGKSRESASGLVSFVAVGARGIGTRWVADGCQGDCPRHLPMRAGNAGLADRRT